MIVFENIIVSDEILTEHFLCNLNDCKGGCCEDGDAGAPLEEWERKKIEESYSLIEHKMSSEAKQVVQEQGFSLWHDEFGWVTPVCSNNGICVYATRDENKTIHCLFEQLHNEKKTEWKKPISCHLYPIRVKKTSENEIVNFEPREKLCKSSCSFGKANKLPLYVFLREALERKFGKDFYQMLQQAAQQVFHK